MQAWLAESEQVLSARPSRFGVLVDMRELAPIGTDVKRLFKVGQELYRRHGMVRSAVIFDNKRLAIQFKRIALQSDIYDYERYLYISETPNWEQAGLDWVIRGIDPDKRRLLIAERVRRNLNIA